MDRPAAGLLPSVPCSPWRRRSTASPTRRAPRNASDPVACADSKVGCNPVCRPTAVHLSTSRLAAGLRRCFWRTARDRLRPPARRRHRKPRHCWCRRQPRPCRAGRIRSAGASRAGGTSRPRRTAGEPRDGRLSCCVSAGAWDDLDATQIGNQARSLPAQLAEGHSSSGRRVTQPEGPVHSRTHYILLDRHEHC